ncbi:MAG: biotin--[acetyl-CoA-carboxylase] ligase, partial [Muribaculaceae bacterium]|nr:biotin--[acetyl-CoA-carboxylase] ligase [Muribaculaceae bacterium]
MEPQINFIDSCASTNSAIPSDAPHGFAIACREQTAGRGQRGASWESEPGMNVTMSVMLRPEGLRAAGQFLISMHTALAVARTLDSYGIAGVRVKWPNDVYVGNRKICGILIENSLSGSMVSRSVCGIGLNVNQTEFRSPAPNPVSMAMLTGLRYDVSEVATRLFRELLAPYPTLADYHARLWRHDGNAWPWVTADGQRITAPIDRVEPTGHIIIAGHPYAFKEIWPADLTDPSR